MVKLCGHPLCHIHDVQQYGQNVLLKSLLQRKSQLTRSSFCSKVNITSPVLHNVVDKITSEFFANLGSGLWGVYSVPSGRNGLFGEKNVLKSYPRNDFIRG